MAAGMVADKHKVDAQKAEAMGMLAPKTGLAALAKVLSEAEGGSLHASVRGAAGIQYWQKLLAHVKPVPRMFAEIVEEVKTKPQPQMEVLL